jgi:hypothetical protein
VDLNVCADHVCGVLVIRLRLAQNGSVTVPLAFEAYADVSAADQDICVQHRQPWIFARKRLLSSCIHRAGGFYGLFGARPALATDHVSRTA